MVDENSKTSYRNYQELHPETVMVAIIGSPEFHVDQVDRGTRTADVDHLHACVVEGDEGAEQIQVACGEHDGKQDLTLSRDTCTGPAFPYFEQQDDDGSQMREVPSQSEDVHGGAVD